MKNCIFHIPWKVESNLLATPDIRVTKMYDAFKSIGYSVEVIWGTAKERKRRIIELKEKIENGLTIDFLYSECSTYPTLLTESHHLPTHPFIDFSFLKFCKRKKIPIGLFYRDVFWNIKHIKRFNWFKRAFSKIFHIYDVFVYNKILDVIFLPHTNMRDYIQFLNKSIKVETLCSGVELKNVEKIYSDKILYVGGISPDTYYDVTQMLKAFTKSEATLYLCCREREWLIYKDFYKQLLSNNIKIIHLNGKELEQMYNEVSYTIIFNPANLYRTITTPYKLFEYLSYEKPIITSAGTTVSEYVHEHDIGYIIEYDHIKLSEFLNSLPNETEYLAKVDNMKLLKNENTWEKRAEKVARVLTQGIQH